MFLKHTQLTLLMLVMAIYFLCNLELIHNITFPKNYAEETLGLTSFVGSQDSLGYSYELAHNQSHGFFDDISNDDWRRLQNITYETWPNHYSKDLMKYHTALVKGSSRVPNGRWHKKNSNWWYAENFQEEFHCQFAKRIPSDSNGDGPKWVCDPHRIAKQKSCLVYSVGSNGNVMFEKAVKEQISEDCEIHTFDPVGYNRRNGEFRKALQGYSTFHQWGLGTENDDRNPTLGLRTLHETVKDLGHEGRQIDIFKIDCELCEWFTYKQWINDTISNFTIKQILVETHNAPMPEAKDFFYDLHDAGYVIFSKEANFQNGGGGVEYGFIKLSTDFFLNNSLYKNL